MRSREKEKIASEKFTIIGGRLVIVPTRNRMTSTHSSSVRPSLTRPSSTLPSSRSDAVKLALAFTAIYIVWGSTYLAIRYAVATIPPLVTAGVRHSVAGGILLVWAWARGFRPKREHWMAGVVVGALFFLGGHGTLHWAEQYVGSGMAALLIATEPMFILLLASAMGQQRLRLFSALGLGLGIAGVAILLGGELTMKGSSLLGLLAVLAGSLSWAAGVVISPKVKLPDDALGRTALPTLCGAAMLLIAAGVTGEFHNTHWASISSKSLFGLAYLIVFGSVVAFTSYTWLLQRCPPALVATHTYANPVVAVLLGWLLAGEALTMRVVVASLAILGAIVLIRRGERVTPEESKEKGPLENPNVSQKTRGMGHPDRGHADTAHPDTAHPQDSMEARDCEFQKTLERA
jgi:drug/metabolite transporter (DMT)-like permease